MSIHLWSRFRWKSRPPLFLQNHTHPFRHAWLYFPPTIIPPASSTCTTTDTSRRSTLCRTSSPSTDDYILDMERTVFKLWSTRSSTLRRRCQSKRQRCRCILDGKPRLATNASDRLHQKQTKDSEPKFWFHTTVTRVLKKFTRTDDSYTQSTFLLTSIVYFFLYVTFFLYYITYFDSFFLSFFFFCSLFSFLSAYLGLNYYFCCILYYLSFSLSLSPDTHTKKKPAL